MSAALENPRRDARPLVVALHCSAGTPGQWRPLADRLEPVYRLLAPSLYGAPGGPVWPGEMAFQLADEAGLVLEEIEAAASPVHLVGHSYGGAVALHIAARHPGRIASLTLYEPSAFHLLKDLGTAGRRALAEFEGLMASISVNYAQGAWRNAAAAFVDYWSGRGAWTMMRPELQTQMVRYLAKGQLEFHALISERVEAEMLAAISVPVRLMRGEHAPLPTRVIAEELAARLPNADIAVIDGAGHMGPLTHAAPITNAIVAHILLSEGKLEARAA